MPRAGGGGNAGGFGGSGGGRGFGGGYGGGCTVAMGHDGHAFFVSDVDQLVDLGSGVAGLGEDTEMVKIHDAGDHDLDKVGTVGFHFAHQVVVFPEICISLADESAVVTGFAEGRQGCAVTDAVFTG